jgi:diguanylate cyclase (GGDEF)-like protein
MKKTIRTGTPFGLLFLDMDNFKAVNDKQGHQFGDNVIKGTVRAIELFLKKGDFIVRFGGDEFIVVLLSAQYTSELKTAAFDITSSIENCTKRTVSVGGEVFQKRYVLSVNKFISSVDKKCSIAKSHKNGERSQIFV